MNCIRARHLLLVSSLILLAGCGGTTAGVDPEEAKQLKAFAESEEEVWGFLPKAEELKPPKPLAVERPRPERPTPRPRPRPKPRRRTPELTSLAGGILIRGGSLSTMSAKEGEWPAAVTWGVGYRWAKGTSARMLLDTGIDFATLESADGAVTSQLSVVRGEILFGDWNAFRSKTIFYFLGGAHAVLADTKWASDGATESAMAAGLELGFGIGSSTAKWDLRAVYSFLTGSENVTGNFLIAAGFSL